MPFSEANEQDFQNIMQTGNHSENCSPPLTCWGKGRQIKTILANSCFVIKPNRGLNACIRNESKSTPFIGCWGFFVALSNKIRLLLCEWQIAVHAIISLICSHSSFTELIVTQYEQQLGGQPQLRTLKWRGYNDVPVASRKVFFSPLHWIYNGTCSLHDCIQQLLPFWMWQLICHPLVCASVIVEIQQSFGLGKSYILPSQHFVSFSCLVVFQYFCFSVQIYRNLQEPPWKLMVK